MNYSKYRNTAKSKLGKYGADCVVVRTSDEKYNPETNEYERQSEEIKGKCLVTSFDASDVDGTNVKAGDVRIMAVLDKEPETGDFITVGTRTYSVVSWSEQNPNSDTAIFYTIQGR